MMKIDTGTQALLCRVEDGVATITLNRPEARNALGEELTPALRGMIKQVGDDPEVGAVLITGAGTAFCAGGDVKSMNKGGGALQKNESGQAQATRQERIADLQQRQRTLTGALVGLRKPTVAALPGPAAGAGLSIALACDLRIAAESAFVSTAYARIGLSGDYGIAWLLTRAVGNARARELLFLPERIDVARCERLGLINYVVPDNELRRAAFELAAKLACGPRIALRNMKDNLDDAVASDFLSALDGEAVRMVDSAQTSDHREAVRAFVEKRSPYFKDRLEPATD
ncbi:MAG: enoyl-CoA hydratase [Betaproteobacteria bacterium]|nr:MAG: enoyl-CoA hydratase [Betaproteobacteria bacterium]